MKCQSNRGLKRRNNRLSLAVEILEQRELLSVLTPFVHNSAPVEMLSSQTPIVKQVTELVAPVTQVVASSRHITASMHAGALSITGDSRGVSLTLSQSARGQLTLTPGAGNDVNGSTNPVTFTGLKGDVKITLGDGDDWIEIDQTTPVTLPGSLIIDGGKGNNTIRTADGASPAFLAIGGDFTVTNHTGNTEVVQICNVNINGNVRVSNSSGRGLRFAHRRISNWRDTDIQYCAW